MIRGCLSAGCLFSNLSSQFHHHTSSYKNGSLTLRQFHQMAASLHHSDLLSCMQQDTTYYHKHFTVSHRVQYLKKSKWLHSKPLDWKYLVKENGPNSFSHVRNFNTKQILERSPKYFQPYLKLIRFDRPIGTYLLFWPCSWSIGLAASAGHLPDWYLLALFGAGSFFMRGAGCIINDMWDQDFDKKVTRTRTRPLASGELTQFNALVMLACNLSISLAILLQLNWYSVFLGAASMILVIAYPLAKRYTYWPQIVLGVTLNWGVLLAWSCTHGALQLPVFPLYMACILNTIIYDTIYSHQDKEDDILIGVKSTALKLGDQTKPWLTVFSGGMVGGLALAGYLCDQTWPFYTAVAATAAHLAHQLYTVNLDNPDDCLKKFKSNTQIGMIMFLGIVIGTLLKADKGGSNKSQEQKS